MANTSVLGRDRLTLHHPPSHQGGSEDDVTWVRFGGDSPNISEELTISWNYINIFSSGQLWLVFKAGYACEAVA